jgi:deoxyribodipyrimidine photo-lyase
MIVGSFLIKDLLIHWQEGARWFWDTLFDANLANNSMGWQWVAGSGVDASPFFRIFNPMLQGAKFDPNGDYVRKWCPELSKLPSEWIHQPFNAPPLILQSAGVRLGEDYPYPLVNHESARQEALAGLQLTKKT